MRSCSARTRPSRRRVRRRRAHRQTVNDGPTVMAWEHVRARQIEEVTAWRRVLEARAAYEAARRGESGDAIVESYAALIAILNKDYAERVRELTAAIVHVVELQAAERLAQ